MTQDVGEKFKDQSNLQQEVINIIKEQYDKIHEIYRVKSKTLIDAIEKSRFKMGKTETRRNLDLQGYQEDLKLLEKKVSFYESYTNKLKALVEEDAIKMLDRLKRENDKLAEGQENDLNQMNIPGLNPGEGYQPILEQHQPMEEQEEDGLTDVEEVPHEEG